MFMFQVVSITQPAWYKAADPAATQDSPKTFREVCCDNGSVMVIEAGMECRRVLQVLSHGVLLETQQTSTDAAPEPKHILHQKVVTRTPGASNSKLTYWKTTEPDHPERPPTWTVSSNALGNLQRFLEGWNAKSAGASAEGVVMVCL